MILYIYQHKLLFELTSFYRVTFRVAHLNIGDDIYHVYFSMQGEDIHEHTYDK